LFVEEEERREGEKKWSEEERLFDVERRKSS